VAGLSSIDQIAAGAGQFTCALSKTLKQVSCWGAGGFGQLGNDPAVDSDVPVVIAGLSNPVAIAVGDVHGCAINSDATIACWGSNGNGQRGNGTTATGPGSTPVMAPDDLSAAGADKITAGDSFTCARSKAGEAYCWGYGQFGEVGVGKDDVFPVPQHLQSLPSIDGIFSGGGHSCALKGGAVSCWGAGFYGEIGDGFYSERDSPAPVPTVTNATLAAPGERHTCVAANGKVSCWGDDRLGQLGDGVLRSTEPVGVQMTCP
jgi:alpha-tubulin suppressor-like RCC1 family protein